MKKILSLILAVAMIASLSLFSSFAANTVELDLSGEALRVVNDAVDVAEEDAGKGGPSWNQVGYWHEGKGGPTDYLVPFPEEPWGAAGFSEGTQLAFMNYGNYIRIAKNIDLSKVTSMTFVWGCDAGVSDMAGYELGLFSKPVAFGNSGDKNTDGLIASVELDLVAPGWASEDNEAVIDLSKVDYQGDLYLSFYMESGNGIDISYAEMELVAGATEDDLYNGTPATPGDEPGGDQKPDDQKPDDQPGNTTTGDTTAIVFMIAAAAVVATVLLKKRAF